MHRLIDPVRSLPNRWRALRRLHDLPDGAYRVPVDVPYVAQFASPDLIHAYIHGGLDGRDDPNWRSFGTDDPDQYTLWAHRACAIAYIKMAADAWNNGSPASSMWKLIEDGLALEGYRTHDAAGRFVDEGWFYPGLTALAAQNGLETQGMAYASLPDVCAAIHEGWLVAVAVTPEIGERGAVRRYDGHFVLVYGFQWKDRRCTAPQLHNPSGRFEELRAGAVIDSRRFGRAFAHRFIAFRKADRNAIR